MAAPRTATITTPASGAIYVSGHRRTVSFSRASSASTIASCTATLTPPTGPDGRAAEQRRCLPTAADGSYTITLIAEDAVRQATTTTTTYDVASGPSP